MGYIGLQYGLFGVVKWAVLADKMASFILLFRPVMPFLRKNMKMHYLSFAICYSFYFVIFA